MLREKNAIEFRELRLFAAVAETRTLTEAAEKLGITQSAVSQVLKQLEQHVGAELVVRRSNPLALTAAGKVLMEHATQILASVRQMTSATMLASENIYPDMRLGFIDSFAGVFARDVLATLSSKVDTISLKTGLTASLDRAFKERDLDVLVSADAMENTEGLEIHPILRDPHALIYSHNMSGKGGPDVAELAEEHPFIGYNRQSRLGAATRLILRRMQVDITERFEFDSTQTLINFVQAKEGWSVVSALCLLHHRELLDGLVIKPIGNNSARYITLKSREGELGNLPAEISTKCRELVNENIVPKLTEIAPWFGEQAYAIAELPPDV